MIFISVIERNIPFWFDLYQQVNLGGVDINSNYKKETEQW